MGVGGAERNPVEVLSEEFLERIRRGEAVTPEEYAEKHPDLADEILAIFPALMMMEELGDETSDRTSSVGGASGAIGGAAAGRLGEFRLLREVGRGGMGVVYEAEQESLGRRVALKVLPAGALTDAKQVRRFEREARSAARLHHINIVPIFGVGEHEGTHYYVMQFIQGQGLDAVLSELKKVREIRGTKSIHSRPPDTTGKGRAAAADIAQSLVAGRFASGPGAATSPPGGSATEAWTGAASPAGPNSDTQTGSSVHGASSTSAVSNLSETDRRFAQGVARIGVQVADALAHAHGQGILHRDIKPSNLLLDREGNVWVTDFGLAKVSGSDDLTHTGDIIGTVRYMAPERFQGSGDARADLYALGLTLYELLALRPAFEETDRASLIRQVTQEDPPQLRRLNRRVPPDLETIIHKTIARDPGHRYQTAGALSDDLQRFLDGRPILARRVSTSERVYRWARRNPALATSLGLCALLLVLTTAGSIIAAARFRNIAEEARLSAQSAQTARGVAMQAGREADARRIDAEGQRLRAEASLGESRASLALARKAVDDSFTKVSESALLNVPGLRPLRRDLLESSLAFYEEFVRRGGDEPGALADLAATQSRVGQILADLGEQAKARVALRKAVLLYDQTLAARPSDVDLLERQSEVWHRLGDLEYRTDRKTANAAFRKAIAIRDPLSAAHPAEPRFRMALSRSFNGLAISAEADSPLDAYRRSLELRLKLADEIPEDPDLLHGLSESFLNLGIRLWASGHRQEALELCKHSIDYGRAGLARRAHDYEFALDLAIGYGLAANYGWELGRREESLAISAEGVAYLGKLSADNPDVPDYRDALGNALASHGQYLRGLGRSEQAATSSRQAAEAFERRPNPDAGALATAAFYRVRTAAILAGDRAGHDFKAWPETARREADIAIADFRAAVDRGLRRPDLIRADPDSKALLSREDMKSLLAEMDRPPVKRSPAKSEARAAPASPLAQPGRLEEDRVLGELTIALLEGEKGKPDQARARLEKMLARIDARRKSGPDSPALEQAARSVQLKLAAKLIELGRSPEAKRLLAAIVISKTDGPKAWVDRGSLLAMLGMSDKAADDFAHAIELLPEDFGGSGARAKFCDMMADYPATYDRLLTLRPSDALLWYVRAEKHLIGRDVRAAVADFARGGEPPATNGFAFIYAAALLLAGEKSSYCDYISRLASRHRDEDEPATLYVLARSAALAENPPTPPDQIVAWADRAVQLQPRLAWYFHTQALAFLRAGNFRAAEKCVGLSRSRLWSGGGSALNDLVLATIHHHEGRPEEARKLLERAKAVFSRTPKAHDDVIVVLPDWLEFEILRGQIEGPLLDAAFPADPFAGGIR